ncbi:MAG TPA: WYL domain-containing protein, partial [Acidimicrobiales bacterium]|nr:WYL domain-containing protein [Acidimicrobiales bacterium]
DASHADYAVAAAGPGAAVQRRTDGGVVLTVGVTNRDAFRSFVLGFLDHAEVLAPPELVADVTGWLAALAAAS